MSARFLLNDTPYPSRLKLSRSDERDVLRRGPTPAWLRPWAEPARIAPSLASHPWGYIHIHGEWDERPVWELVGFWSPDDLNWGLEILFRYHDWYLRDVDGYLNDHECHGVFYWLPDDPRLLPLPLGVSR